MELERDWLNLARTILLEHHTEYHNVRKKTARKYNRSNKERYVCCSVTKLNKIDNQREILWEVFYI